MYIFGFLIHTQTDFFCKRNTLQRKETNEDQLVYRSNGISVYEFAWR